MSNMKIMHFYPLTWAFLKSLDKDAAGRGYRWVFVEQLDLVRLIELDRDRVASGIPSAFAGGST